MHPACTALTLAHWPPLRPPTRRRPGSSLAPPRPAPPRRHEAYDSRADVWSFGVLLVELLTQQKPYCLTYMTPVQVAIQVADGSLRPQPPADCHPGLQELLGAVFAPDPQERPPFALIVARLEAVLRDVRAAAAAAQTQETVLGRWLGKVGKVGS